MPRCRRGVLALLLVCTLIHHGRLELALERAVGRRQGVEVTLVDAKGEVEPPAALTSGAWTAATALALHRWNKAQAAHGAGAEQAQPEATGSAAKLEHTFEQPQQPRHREAAATDGVSAAFTVCNAIKEAWPAKTAMLLACPYGTIGAVLLASYGGRTAIKPGAGRKRQCAKTGTNPQCHAPESASIVRSRCMGRRNCRLPLNIFPDACPGRVKWLTVVVSCTYLKATEVDPRHVNAHNNLGMLLEDKGDLAGAEAAYKKGGAFGRKQGEQVDLSDAADETEFRREQVLAPEVLLRLLRRAQSGADYGQTENASANEAWEHCLASQFAVRSNGDDLITDLPSGVGGAAKRSGGHRFAPRENNSTDGGAAAPGCCPSTVLRKLRRRPVVLKSIGDTNSVNLPSSAWRPSPLTALARAPDTSEAPLVTIITATLNPRAKDLLKVAYTILHQTLRPIRWIIIDDGSDPPSVQLMRQVTASDHRVELMQSSSRPGDPISAGRAGKARNEAFRHVKSPYVLFADDDDPFELTYLEKAVWFLETNTGYDACGSDVMTVKEMTTGAWQQQAWDRGWTNPDDFRMMNPLVIQQIVRTSALQALAHGRRGPFPVHIKWAEDWALWAHFIQEGSWGFSLPEPLIWVRTRQKRRWNANAMRGQREIVKYVRSLDSKLAARILQRTAVKRMERYRSTFPTELPFANHYPRDTASTADMGSTCMTPQSKRLMMIVPWLTLGGADEWNLNVVRKLTEDGYHVTLVTTLYNQPHSMVRLPQFMQYTHDVFSLPLLLAQEQHPRFVDYLIASRGVRFVVVTNSMAGYQMLPYLRQRHPNVVFMDYVHMEEDGWNFGGYAKQSLIMSGFLDKTLVASKHLLQWYMSRGASPERTESLYIGVDVDKFQRNVPDRMRMRKELGLSDKVVLLFACRIVQQKRPLMFVSIIEQIVRRSPSALHKMRVLVVGEGDLKDAMQEKVHSAGLDGVFVFSGPVPNELMRPLMTLSDIFLQPSEMEGISLSLYESMAMSLPVVVADVGGQAELLGGVSNPAADAPLDEACGFNIAKVGGQREMDQYADALLRMINASPLTLARMGRRCRTHVKGDFSVTGMSNHLQEHLRALDQSIGERNPPMQPNGSTNTSSRALEKTLAYLVTGEMVASAGVGDINSWLPLMTALWRMPGARWPGLRFAHSSD